MSSKRKILRKIQLGILPPNPVSSAILVPPAVLVTSPESTVTELTTAPETIPELAVATTTEAPIIEVAAEEFRKHYPKLKKTPAKKKRTRKPTAKKKTTKTNKSS
jgi:hypothetical protein